ncbi:ABC transporter ATP-binding protein [Christensenellaceae bacterium OttesenSCG-928-L17]|nr:ABC transporter ATP-binding protein [Christensenellaceae bacterium OttesenSCG-928-L17]
MKHTLTVNNLKHTYSDGQNSVEVLKGTSAEFKSGEIYAIVGESGSGKTTLISLISALDKVQHGTIKYDGKSLKSIGETEFRRRYVNIVFQSFNLIRYMTARENVEVALDFANRSDKSKQIAYDVLTKVGIKRSEADRLVQKLSGGQQQRVAIARALASDTPIIVADEPTGNLDEKTEQKILELFKTLAELNKIIIIVTHSKKVATYLHAHTLHMEDGLLSRQ